MGILDDLFGDQDDDDPYNNRHDKRTTGIFGLNIQNRIKNARKNTSSLMQNESNYQNEKFEKERKKQVDKDVTQILKNEFGITRNPPIHGMDVSMDTGEELGESPLTVTFRKKIKEFEDLIQP